MKGVGCYGERKQFRGLSNFCIVGGVRLLTNIDENFERLEGSWKRYVSSLRRTFITMSFKNMQQTYSFVERRSILKKVIGFVTSYSGLRKEMRDLGSSLNL